MRNVTVFNDSESGGNITVQTAGSLMSTIAFVTFGCCVIIENVLGNLLVILAISKEPKLKQQKQNLLIFSLASADFLVGLVIMPMTLLYETLGTWVLGMILCELWLSLDVLFVTASILHLCAISVDRYMSVSSPLQHQSANMDLRMKVMILLAWVIALLISLPPVVGWRPDRQLGECALSTDKAYVLYSASGSFFLPVIAIVLLNARVYMIGKKHLRNRQKATKKTANALLGGYANESAHASPRLEARTVTMQQTTSAAVELCSMKNGSGSLDRRNKSSASLHSSSPRVQRLLVDESARRMRHSIEGKLPDVHKESLTIPTMEIVTILSCSNAIAKQFESRMKASATVTKRLRRLKAKERQATLMLGIVLLGFIACWLPFFTIYVAGAFGFETEPAVFTVFFWLGYINSGVNPVIYAVLNADFRKAFSKLLGLKKFGWNKLDDGIRQRRCSRRI